MRKPIMRIMLAGLFLASSFSLHAADTPALKVVTVDVVKVMSGYWKKRDSENKLADAMQQAEEYLNKESLAIDEIKKNLDDAAEQAQSSALTKEAQDRAMEDAKKIYAQLQEKGQQAQQFKENKERELQLKRANDNRMFFAEIKQVVLNLSKGRGATIVVDTSSVSNIGVPTVIYADPSYDITEAVVAELNKSKPADFKME